MNIRFAKDMNVSLLEWNNNAMSLSHKTNHSLDGSGGDDDPAKPSCINQNSPPSNPSSKAPDPPVPPTPAYTKDAMVVVVVTALVMTNAL